ncbi:MAG: ice-binding family protein, partial [Chloroflexota bacterium]|nr:ice-binding family protein [Chloroflexota bacterium]
MKPWIKVVGATGVLVLAISAIAGPTANAAYSTPVPLGAARTYAVLSGAALTGNATTAIDGNVGWGTAITYTGTVSGTTTGPMSAWQTAHDNLVTAYNDALTRTSTVVPAELGGTTLTRGVYHSEAAAAFAITTPLTLNGQGDSTAVFILKTGATAGLDTTATNGNVVLTNGALACNVFWQVGGAVTLGASTAFKGNILASAAITLGANTTLVGRAFSVNAAVTLDANMITGCDTTIPVITAPTPVSFVTGPGALTCGATVSDAALGATVTDNAAGPLTLSHTPSGNIFSVGSTTLTWNATDAAGNAALPVTQVVNVTDNTVPTISSVPAAASYQFAGQVLAGNPNDAVAADNCAFTVAVVDTDNAGAGTPASPLIITRTFTATDTAGNSS